ncbi:MAG TPA: glycosyltransferase [Candidatus Saccharimonadia bacterium]|nr:glycosyltransferase [Candidatus Saccharimonadia bacterium]
MPANMSPVSIVLPAYNEEKDLPLLLERLHSTMSATGRPYRIVVVDDGSADRTAEIAQEASTRMPVHLVRHPKNMGLGRAIQTGLMEARQFGGFIVTMDADNSHDPCYIEQMVRVLEEQPVDVVIASRYQKGSVIKGVPYYRQVLSLGCFVMMKSILPFRNVRDYSTGFRVYRASVISRLVQQFGDQLVEVSGFACMLELLAKLRLIGANVVEIPYTLRYDQKVGVSKLRLFRTLRQYWTVVSKFRTAATAGLTAASHPRRAVAALAARS